MLYDISWLSIQAVIFTDYSTLRQPAERWQTMFESNSMQVYSGLGIRVSLDNYYQTILRVDFGTDAKTLGEQVFNDGGLVVGIGQYF